MNRRTAGFILALATLATIAACCFCSAVANGAEPVDVGGWRHSAVASAEHPAVVRVGNKLADGTCYGTGTLVDKNAERGIVVTCYHLFRNERTMQTEIGKVTCCFPGQGCFPAEVLAVDKVWDLAVLKVASPQAEPVTIASVHPKSGDAITVCGYGLGQYECQSGRVNGYVRPQSDPHHEWLQWRGVIRDGDSGGPVFNTTGELVAVAWGASHRDYVSCGAYCGRIRKFLGRLLGIRPRRPLVVVDANPPSAPPVLPGPGPPPEPPDEPLVPLGPSPVTPTYPPLPPDPLAGINAAIKRLTDNQAGLTDNQTALIKTVTDLAALIEAMPPGAKGDKGDTGAKGEQGIQGLPGEAGEFSEGDLDALAAKVIAKLPPLPVRRLYMKRKGTPDPPVPVPADDTEWVPYHEDVDEVNWIDGEGLTIRTFPAQTAESQ